MEEYLNLHRSPESESQHQMQLRVIARKVPFYEGFLPFCRGIPSAYSKPLRQSDSIGWVLAHDTIDQSYISFFFFFFSFFFFSFFLFAISTLSSKRNKCNLFDKIIRMHLTIIQTWPACFLTRLKKPMLPDTWDLIPERNIANLLTTDKNLVTLRYLKL